jgi:predicted dehydrogenase
MEDILNFGIIGAGMIGDKHIESIQATPYASVKSIAARTQQTVDQKVIKYDIPHGTTSYHEILNDPQITAVVIATPPYLHKQILLDSLDAGKHILIEKPMVTAPDDLELICNAVNNHPECIVVECSCRHSRLQPKFKLIRQMIKDGLLGEIYHIHHNHLTRGTFIEYNPAGSWMLDKSTSGGGPFMDWGPYDLSFHLGILDDVPQISSVQSFTRCGLKKFRDLSIHQNIEEHGAAFLKFDTGLTYYYERGAGVHCEQKNETRIYGTKGCLRFGYLTWDSPEIEFFHNDLRHDEKRTILTADMSMHTNDHLELITHFINCINHGYDIGMTPELATKHLSILFQIIRGTGA